METDKINAEVFLKTAECGSFAAAAKELGYTQAGVSYIVNAMEEELGFSLFTREYGGVRLSTQGELLQPYIQALNNDERLLGAKINDLRALRCGKLKVLTFDSVSVHWLPWILRDYKRDYPGVDIELITMENSAQAEQMVRRQDVDCAFFLHTPRSKDLDVFPLMTERLMAIVPVDHPLAGLEKFPVAELGSYPYIRMAFGEETGISNIFRVHGVQPQIAYNLDNDHAAMAMVSAGHGFCIFPELSLRNAPFDLRIMEFDEPVTRTVSIAVRSAKTCSAPTAMFLKYTRRYAENFLRE